MSETNHAMPVGVASWQLVEQFSQGRQASSVSKSVVLLKMHGAIKFDGSCQSRCLPQTIEFQPSTTWKGLHGFSVTCGDLGLYTRKYTYALGNEAMNDPETPPLQVLERLNGKTLH